jgi:hypothetical protein
MLSFFRAVFSPYTVFEIADTGKYIVCVYTGRKTRPYDIIKKSVVESLKDFSSHEIDKKGISFKIQLASKLRNSEISLDYDITKAKLSEKTRHVELASVNSLEEARAVIQAHKKIRAMFNELIDLGKLELVQKA